MEHDAVLEVIAAWPTPAELKRAGKARIDARRKRYGCRRHAAWADQIVLALEHQSVVVVGTDAVGTVLPHRPASSSPHAPSGLMSPPRPVALAGGPPSCARS